MTDVKYIGMDVHKETISIAVMNNAGKLLMESHHRNQGGHHSAVLCRLARRSACHFRGSETCCGFSVSSPVATFQ